MVTPESPYTVRENIRENITETEKKEKPPLESGVKKKEATIASLAGLEGEKQVAQQEGSGEGIEDGASIGEDTASGTIPPGKPSSPFPDDDTNTLGPSTSSPDEPLSATFTDDRSDPGAEGIDHAQRSLGPIYMVAGGLEKKEAADHGKVSDALAALKAAKKDAIDAIGKGKFLKRDLVLNHLLAAVPDNARDGLRALEYLEWANELVEDEMGCAGASGGAA